MLHRKISISSRCFFMLFSSVFSSWCLIPFATMLSCLPSSSWSFALFLVFSICFDSLGSMPSFSASIFSISTLFLYNSGDGSHTSLISLHRLINSTLFNVFKFSNFDYYLPVTKKQNKQFSIWCVTFSS